MTPDQALREAREQKLRSVYLLIGEERHLQSQLVSALREAVLSGGTPGLNEDQMVAGEASIDSILSAAKTLPMLAKRRLVLVRSLERWEPRGEAKNDAKEERQTEALDKLAEYAKAPVPSTTLVLVASKLDSRRRLMALAKKDGFLVSCEPLARHELPAYVDRAVRDRQCAIAPGLADFIAELAGPELGAVEDAVERVCLYVGQGGTVTEDAISECVIRVRPATVWELVGAVGRRDVGTALAALDEVYDPQDRGLRLVGLLAWSARQLLRFESAVRSGLDPQEAAKAAGAPPFKARELGDQVKRIPRVELERWLERLAEVDLALKGGSRRQPKAVLEHAVIELCARRSGTAKGGTDGGRAQNRARPRA
jgi:DNA polymerase III subunit delta